MKVLRRYSALLYISLSTIYLLFDRVFAVVVDLPPARGQDDIAITGPTRIQGNETEIYDFIWLINEYLWFSITVITFAAALYAWFKLITNTGWSNDGFDTLVNVL